MKVFSIGDPDAPVKIVEFADLECGACRRAFVQIKSVLEKFNNKVYFEFRHFPLNGHSYSKLFAKASVCAGEQDQFFEYVETVFANQQKLSKVSPLDLARKINIDDAKFESCMSKNTAQFIVEEDIREANRLGVESTPTFYINGQIFMGIPSVSDINAIL